MNTTKEIYEDLYKDILECEKYELGEDKASRVANLFAVKASWLIASNLIYSKSLEENNVNGIEFSHATMFAGFFRLWKMHLKDGSWVIVFDEGNGNYAQVTEVNSYTPFKLTPCKQEEQTPAAF